MRSPKTWVKRFMTYPLRVVVKDIDAMRQYQSLQETVAFIDTNLPLTPSFPDRFQLMQFALSQSRVRDGLVCEFGVHQAESINHIARWKPEAEIHGFDSFEGLPEEWQSNIGKGAFALATLPKVAPNVRLHKGWFDQTLPLFSQRFPRPIAFLHVDADLYSSTKTIFDVLGDQIVPGTIIQFDEYFNYPGWQQHEHRAFREFCEERAVSFEYLGFARCGEQIAVKITALTVASQPKLSAQIAIESDVAVPCPA